MSKSSTLSENFAQLKGKNIERAEELADVVAFLKNPKKFDNKDAKFPKGILLSGPAGNGKSALARALAGESGAYIFEASGADFDTSLVGDEALTMRRVMKMTKHTLNPVST